MKKYFFSFVLFTIIVSILFTGCETLGSGKKEKWPYFTEEKEKEPLKKGQKIMFFLMGLQK